MPNGVIIINKPQGWTSMDVCAKLRGIFREKRVGHAGTLDPMATGVLPVFVGQATKAVSFAEGGRKEYRERSAVAVSEDEVRAVLPRFTGELSQIPPMYSAVKIGGQKLYEIARRGGEVERKPRTVTIYELELTGRLAADEYALRIVCSKGTYIRTLCHDIGAVLGCGAAMAALTRTVASGFTLGEAVTLEEVQAQGEALLRPTDSLFREYPVYTLPNAEAERRVRCGNPLKAELADGAYRVYGCDGTFLALSRAEKGVLTSQKNFFCAE